MQMILRKLQSQCVKRVFAFNLHRASFPNGLFPRPGAIVSKLPVAKLIRLPTADECGLRLLFPAQTGKLGV